MDRSRKKKYGKLALKLGVTILLIVLVVKKTDISETKRIFQHSHPQWLFLATGIYFCSFLVSNIRSRAFLNGIGIRLPFAEGMKLYLRGTVYNIILPGGGGGDGYKILALRKTYGVPAKKIFWAFFFERLSGLWAIGALLAGLGFIIPKHFADPILLLLAFAIATMVYALVMKRFFSEYAGGFATKHLLSAGIQCLVMASVSCILFAQQIPFSLPAYLFSFQSSTIVSVLNIGLSGLGVREFAMSYASDLLSTDPALSVYVATTFWIISTLASLPGLLFVFRERSGDEMHPADTDMKTVGSI
jgi:uncharacterized membrane protein YbhN (UPF0104 family)